MTAGRLFTYIAILAASAGLSRFMMQRRPLPRVAGERRATSTVRPVPAAPAARAAAAPAASARPLPPEPAPPSDSAEVLSLALCPSDMIWVGASTCATPTRPCAERSGEVCRRFEPARCRPPGQELRFCIDRYEYPNRRGMLPAAMVTFDLARTACEAEGKRLCSESEWTLACEGHEGRGYPYGDEERPAACNVARAVPKIRPEELWEARDVSPAVARVDARVASGGSPDCESPFGVSDLTGNVEEWVVSDASELRGALRGGEYTAEAPTCRTVREIHDPHYRSFHTGFRCCRDPLVRPAHRPGEDRP